jgi:probable phosphomutase (TIGR03848 family)
VTTVLLVRHGLTALTGPVLAGWTPGVNLDDRGRAQAEALAARLAPVPLDAIVTSPLERCRQTALAIAAAAGPSHDGQAEPAVRVDDRVGECHYGDWTGKQLKKLAKEPLWRVVQAHPSGARFPGPDGEALPDMQYRAVAAVREWNAKLGRDACYVVCSHGDVIKAIVADSLGVHLDLFQRIQIDPCSLTVIRYTELRPFLLRLNDTGGDVGGLTKAARGAGRAGSDATVGGGAGADGDNGGAGADGDNGGEGVRVNKEDAAGDGAGSGVSISAGHADSESVGVSADAVGHAGTRASCGHGVQQQPAEAQG